MDRAGSTCSSSCNSSAGFQSKRRPYEEEGKQVGLRDRAARKERERERLRELLNRGKKKRRRISTVKLLVPPAIVVCASVPRKPRSVRSRRKGKSWVSSYSNPNLQPPSSSGRSPPLVQNEVEMEIAEVLFGLQKQESPPVTVQNCEPLFINAASVLDKPVLKQEVSTVEEGVASTSTSAVEAKIKRQGKFVIDLMKPPPDELAEELPEVARSKSNLKTTSQDKELGNSLCSIKEEVVYENRPPLKMLIKAESRDFDQDHKLQLQKQQIKTRPNTSIADGLSQAQIGPSLLSLGGESHVPLPGLKPPDFRLVQSGPKRCITHRTIAQSIYRHQQTLRDDGNLLGSERILRNRPQGLVPVCDLNCAKDRAQAIEVYLRTSDKAGSFVFPFSQNQTVMARQSEIPLSASSPASMRYSHPNGAPFFAVVPECMGKKMQPTGGRKNIQPLPFFDRQLLPAQMFYPVQIQQPRNFPSATPRCQRVMTDQGLHAGRGGSMSSIPFAYPRQQGNSVNAGGPDLNFSLAPNSVCPRGFSDNSNQMQHRNSQVFQSMNRGEFMQAEKLSFAKQTALSTRTQFSNSNNSQVFQQQQMLHAMAASQLRLPPTNSARVSRDFTFFSGNLFDRSKSSHSMQQRASDIKQAYEVFP